MSISLLLLWQSTKHIRSRCRSEWSVYEIWMYVTKWIGYWYACINTIYLYNICLCLCSYSWRLIYRKYTMKEKKKKPKLKPNRYLGYLSFYHSLPIFVVTYTIKVSVLYVCMYYDVIKCTKWSVFLWLKQIYVKYT